jgi:hypothetical protein
VHKIFSSVVGQCVIEKYSSQLGGMKNIFLCCYEKVGIEDCSPQMRESARLKNIFLSRGKVGSTAMGKWQRLLLPKLFPFSISSWQQLLSKCSAAINPGWYNHSGTSTYS